VLLVVIQMSDNWRQQMASLFSSDIHNTTLYYIQI